VIHVRRNTPQRGREGESLLNQEKLSWQATAGDVQLGEHLEPEQYRLIAKHRRLDGTNRASLPTVGVPEKKRARSEFPSDEARPDRLG
jgi:hypothetical protein